jgi:hypothetical protein
MKAHGRLQAHVLSSFSFVAGNIASGLALGDRFLTSLARKKERKKERKKKECKVVPVLIHLSTTQ